MSLAKVPATSVPGGNRLARAVAVLHSKGQNSPVVGRARVRVAAGVTVLAVLLAGMVSGVGAASAADMPSAAATPTVYPLHGRTAGRRGAGRCHGGSYHCLRRQRRTRIGYHRRTRVRRPGERRLRDDTPANSCS